MTLPATVNLADGITWDDVIDVENPDALTLEGTTLSFTQVRDDSQILVKGNGKVHIQGGVHVNPRIRAGATVDGATQIEITGNVFTHYLSMPRATPVWSLFHIPARFLGRVWGRFYRKPRVRLRRS